MDISQLNQILNQGEGNKIEFKEAQSGVPASLYETISSFSNTSGGTILLGVNDAGTVLGLDNANIGGFITNIIITCNSQSAISPSLFLSPTSISHPDGEIIIIDVPVHSQVVRHANRIYWRDGDADLDITNNNEQVSQLYLQKCQHYSETVIYPQLRMTDLAPELFQEARTIIRGFSVNHPWLSVDDQQLLREASLYRRDFSTGEEGFTLAAALIFGKDETIHSLLPAYKVEAMVRRENQDRWDDRVTLRTNLIHTYQSLMDFIRKHLPEKFYMENDQRVNLRDLIFHEIIGNFVVHREYTSARSSDLVITPTVVELTNPNNPPFHGPLDLESFSPYPKNPNIRRFFTAFGWTEEIGSGVRNTSKYLNQYVPHAKPLFIENELFRAEIPLHFASLSEFANEFIIWLELHTDALDHVRSGLEDIALDPGSGSSSWPDVLLQLVPGWHAKGTRLTELNWPKNQALTVEEIKNVPGWDELGTKLLHKKIRYLIGILTLVSDPIGMTDMMEWISYSNRKTFRDNYLIPLQEVGFVRMTNPDNPSDPEQKYVVTEKGKLFLAGRIIE